MSGESSFRERDLLFNRPFLDTVKGDGFPCDKGINDMVLDKIGLFEEVFVVCLINDGGGLRFCWGRRGEDCLDDLVYGWCLG